MPFSIWGKLQRDVGEWDVSAKLDTYSDSLGLWDLDLEARGGPTDLTVTARGNVDLSSQTGELLEVGLRQSFEAPGGDLSLFPRFIFAKRMTDVRIEYQHEDTRIQIDADMDSQRISLAHSFDENNSFSPSIRSDGEIELEYRRAIGDGVMTANYKPNHSTIIKYEDGPWVANVDIPMDGYFKFGGGPKLNIRRSVSLEAM